MGVLGSSPSIGTIKRIKENTVRKKRNNERTASDAAFINSIISIIFVSRIIAQNQCPPVKLIYQSCWMTCFLKFMKNRFYD